MDLICSVEHSPSPLVNSGMITGMYKRLTVTFVSIRSIQMLLNNPHEHRSKSHHISKGFRKGYWKCKLRT